MEKEMRFESKPLSVHKQNHFLVKFAVSFLLIGLAFRIFFSDSIRLSSVLETTPLAEQKPEPPLAEPKAEDSLAEQKTVSSLPSSPAFDFPRNESQTSQNDAKKCDIFRGNWIPDPSGPRYTNESCHVMEAHQNCMKNGRPDSGYFYWRWSPWDCDLPKFNPRRFLDMMRNKSMAFIGDSISRNHVQSLLCVLSQILTLGT